MKYLVLDIETMPSSSEELEVEASFIKPNANIKDPIKKEKNVAEKIEKLKSKNCLLDSSPIACIGVKTPDYAACFTCFNQFSDDELSVLRSIGILIITADSEKQMLENYSTFLQLSNNQTEIVTFNGFMFDIPKIRNRFAVHNVPVPRVMGKRQPGNDLMITYSKHFSMNNNIFVGMSEVLKRLGICEGKIMSGEFFYQLVEQNEHLKAVLYNILDCYLTEQIYFRLRT